MSRAFAAASSLDNRSQFDIAALLRQYHLRPKKQLGQNFLQDDGSLRKIISIAEIESDDAVLEIGPGLGSLTRYLALSARAVTAVELDESLFPVLHSILAPYDNVRLIRGNILELSPSELINAPDFLVVANIPYNITSNLMRHLLEETQRPRRLVLTIQREVAERICAEPGDLSLLALSIQVFGKPETAAYIPARDFYPPPKVDSAVVRIDVYDSPFIPYPLLEKFFRLARAGFSQKRKTLRNALSGGLGISTVEVEHMLTLAGIDSQRRAQTVSLSEWRKLADCYPG